MTSFKSQIQDIVKRYAIEPIPLQARIIQKNVHKRWFTCAVLIGDRKDGHNDIIAPSLVEELADEFITNLHTKFHAVQHREMGYDIQYIGHWYTDEGGTFDGLTVPPYTWLARLKINDDGVWQRIINGELRGMSPAGKFIVEILE